MEENKPPDNTPATPSGLTGETIPSTPESTNPQDSVASPDAGASSDSTADTSPVPQITGQPYVNFEAVRPDIIEKKIPDSDVGNAGDDTGGKE